MANIELRFLDVEDSTALELKSIYDVISIYVYDSNDEDSGKCIHLDVPTAIKLHKTLRHEINKAKEGGQNA